MAFEALARAIFRMEGVLDASGNWITSSVGYRNNNPGNLVYAGQPGATPLSARDPNLPGSGNNIVYARFATLEDGIRATERQLALDAGRGKTLAERLSTWAGANQEAYIRNVSSWLGVEPSTPLADLAVGWPGNFSEGAPGEAAGAVEGDGASGQDWPELTAETQLSGAAIGAVGLAAAVLLLVVFSD